MVTKRSRIVSVGLCPLLVFAGANALSAATYYVSLSGNDKNDGIAPDKAWRTISCAATEAQAGDTVYIQGGDYGAEHVVIGNSGTEGNPIVFQGYKNRPGDEPKPDESPLLDGHGNKDRTFGIEVRSKRYITIKRIALRKYTFAFYVAGGASHVDLYDVTAYENHNGICFETAVEVPGGNNTIRNCTAYNNDMCNFLLKGSWTNCLIEDCKSYNIEGLHSYADYYFAVTRGATYNTIRNCIAGGYPKTKYHWAGHGFAFMGWGKLGCRWRNQPLY